MFGFFSRLDDKIMEALRTVRYEGADVVTRGMISGLNIDKNNNVFFVLEVDSAMGAAMEDLRRQCEAAVQAVKSVKKVFIVLTAERKTGGAGASPVAVKPEPASSPDPHGMNKNPPLDLPIKHIIAVASGKGGVGKSTVSFNLAVALAQMGYSVGLMDADIYGPSVPHLSGLSGQKPQMGDAGKLIPLTAHGLKLMSIGFMVEEDKAMIWRGPMIQSAFYQMLRDVDWCGNDGRDLDILVIDMPPGTGDVQLTLAQKVPVSGAVIVTTPQDLALIDARKAIEMFTKTSVRVLGVVENMSYYCCPSCGHRDEIFGHGGGAEEAQRRGLTFLGGIPLNSDIRTAADAGKPINLDIYKEIAEKLSKSLD